LAQKYIISIQRQGETKKKSINFVVNWISSCLHSIFLFVYYNREIQERNPRSKEKHSMRTVSLVINQGEIKFFFFKCQKKYYISIQLREKVRKSINFVVKLSLMLSSSPLSLSFSVVPPPLLLHIFSLLLPVRVHYN